MPVYLTKFLLNLSARSLAFVSHSEGSADDKLDWRPGTGSIHSRYLYGIALLPRKHRPRVYRQSSCLVLHRHSEFVRDGGRPYYYPAVDWYDELFNDYALSTRVNANLSGGGSAVRYYVAASYTKDGGVIKNDKLNNYNSNINWQRYSVRSNINMDLSKTTEFAIRVNGNFDDYTGPLDSGEGPYKKVMKTSPVLYPKSYPATDEYANNTHVLFGNANKGAYINPYADMVRGYKESNNLLVAAQAELKQKLDFITQGLDARVLVSTTRSSYSDLTRAINPYYYQANYDKTNNSYKVLRTSTPPII